MLELNKIYCGDCLDLMREMPDKSVDLVLTDPPYGGILTKKTGNGVLKDIACRCGGGDWDIKPTKEYFLEVQRVSRNQIIFGGNYFTDHLPPSPAGLFGIKTGSPHNRFQTVNLPGPLLTLR